MQVPLFTILWTIILLINKINAQIPQQFTIQNPCVSKPTCHECIQTPSCAWCYHPDYINNPRCFQPSYPLPPKDQCPEGFAFNPDNIQVVISDLELSKSKERRGQGGKWISGVEADLSHIEDIEEKRRWKAENGQSASIIQVKPQRIQLKLRARQTYSITMKYTQAEDYPVDLYYLMDLSKSMEDDKEKLSLLGDHLAQTMQNITTNFTLGFGSFVDKVVMPYVSTIPENLIAPCPGCKAPYGFRNMMPLSTNTYQFSHMVREASVSGNLDAPEGGFDAIMQAVVCRHEIGWREKARRLLVFSTDAGFHYAGDGKLGGIVKPNDGCCHLDTRGYYSMSSKQDYPSISQLNLFVKKNAINVIFAVTADKINVYKQLQQHIEGASCAKLSNDSSNIVELIKDQYEQISSTVEMKHNATQAINIKFFTKCLNNDGPLIETNKCGNIKVGNLIEFRIDLEIIKCPRDPNEWQQTIKIYPIGINESLIIDLEMLCSCPCEHAGDQFYIEHAMECHHHGTYKCGICECEPGNFGRTCECQTDEVINLNQTTGCISPLNNLECSGRGSCVCGTCECIVRTNDNERINGKYCECDNFSCERHNGQLCSGPDHGICDCGRCQCNDGWTGDNCACMSSNTSCYAPDNIDGKICSGNGICECGVCKCNTIENGRILGKYCEICPTCSNRCEEFIDCVQCQMYKTGPLNEKECEACTFTPISVDVVEVIEKNNENLCPYYDKDDCYFAYVYYFDEDKNIAIRAQSERKCPKKIFLLGIVLGVIAAVVLMGLAVLLLWKLLTTIHDRREFAKFEKERMMAKWDTGENPIYKQATSTFKNPTYAGKS